MRRGAGGITRSNSHSSGNVASAVSTHGLAKAIKPKFHMAYRRTWRASAWYMVRSGVCGGRSVTCRA